MTWPTNSLSLFPETPSDEIRSHIQKKEKSQQVEVFLFFHDWPFPYITSIHRHRITPVDSCAPARRNAVEILPDPAPVSRQDNDTRVQLASRAHFNRVTYYTIHTYISGWIHAGSGYRSRSSPWLIPMLLLCFWYVFVWPEGASRRTRDNTVFLPDIYWWCCAVCQHPISLFFWGSE